MFGFRRLAYTLLSRHFWVGIAIGFSLASVFGTVAFALTSAEADLIFEEQNDIKKQTGRYETVISPELQVFTYEKLCKGFYVIEDNGIRITQTGFGDLAEEYTLTKETEKQKLSVASTTNEEPIVFDITSTTTE